MFSVSFDIAIDVLATDIVGEMCLFCVHALIDQDIRDMLCVLALWFPTLVFK